MCKSAEHKKAALDVVKQTLSKGPTTKLLAGVGTGWLSGMITVRAGRVPIALLGTSIILFQAAHDNGLVSLSWNDVFSKATEASGESKHALAGVRQFATDNPAFTAGFTGGFLIGLVC